MKKRTAKAVRFLLRALRALDSRSVSGIQKPSFARLLDTDAKSQRAVLAHWLCAVALSTLLRGKAVSIGSVVPIE